MKKRELQNLGLSDPELLRSAAHAVAIARRQGMPKGDVRAAIRGVIENPSAYTEHPMFSSLANELLPFSGLSVSLKARPVEYRTWGNTIEHEAHEQMRNACTLPCAVGGALMPDAHLGYGLPIGGVLATDNCVIPYAVGVDIGCRVKITLTDLPLIRFGQDPALFSRALEQKTRFGKGVQWEERKDHQILDHKWDVTPLTSRLKDLAWKQLGTSGSGNHFVEFGELELFEEVDGVVGGRYLALVSHSGSRGPGAAVANHYTKVAASRLPGLTGKMKHLAWLPLDSEPGMEYWEAMQLMGDFASANHEVIHREVLKFVRARSVLSVENHHNFAWRESYDGRELIVHRKGATPASKGVRGYIPGTMADPGFLVEGLGQEEAYRSCAHGAGRAMSRRSARQTTTRHALNNRLKEAKVTLLSCGLDESPHAYKAIGEVMRAQSELVKVLGKFSPRFVKMAPEGEKPED